MKQRTISHTILTATSALALAFAGTIVLAAPASAVAGAADASAGTEAALNLAIDNANGNPGLDTITLTGAITLSVGLHSLTDDTTIKGGGFLITGTMLHGVFTDTAAPANTKLTFDGLNVTAALYAIITTTSDVTITGSQFADAPVNISGVGISVSAETSAFDGAPGDPGIVVSVSATSTVAIKNSTARGNSGAGILLDLDASRAEISGVTAELNGTQGVVADLQNASDIQIRESHSNDNSSDGFWVSLDSSTGTVSTSTAERNDDNGVEIETKNSTAQGWVTDFTSTDNAYGIYFRLRGGEVTGTRMTATGSTEEGIDVFTRNHASTVTVSDSAFTDTDGVGAWVGASDGAAILFQNSTFSENSDGGIQIYSNGGGDNTFTLRNSTVADNDGTGVLIETDSNLDTVISGSTISGNVGNDLANYGSWGGGVAGELDGESSLTIVDSTIANNSSTGDWGSGIDVYSDAEDTMVSILHTTVVANINDGQGDENYGGISLMTMNFVVSHTISAGNVSGSTPNDFTTSNSEPPLTAVVDFNLIQAPATGDAAAFVAAGTGNIVNTAPKLGPLANNGLTTLTMLPLDGSPVINAGNPAVAGAPATDQRGLQRKVGVIDIGAVEVQRAVAMTGADATAPLTGGVIVLGVGILLLALRRRWLAV